MWQGRDGPLNYIESLKEAPLGWLQGMTNGMYCSLTLLLLVTLVSLNAHLCCAMS